MKPLHYIVWFTTLILLSLMIPHKYTAGNFNPPENADFAINNLIGPELIATDSPESLDYTPSRLIAFIEERASVWGVDGSVMVRIAYCESRLRQFEDDGSVLRGIENPNDIGLFQIQVDPTITDWLRISKELGHDIYTLEGNVEMAMWIASNTTRSYKHWVCYN